MSEDLRRGVHLSAAGWSSSALLLCFPIVSCSEPGAGVVASLVSPYSSEIRVEPVSGKSYVAQPSDFEQGEISLLKDTRVVTNETGEVVVGFLDIGKCSLWHTSAIVVRGPNDHLFSVEETGKELFCAFRRPAVVTTALGQLELSGTTFGILLDANGMTVRMFDGSGLLEGSDLGVSQELVPGEEATIRQDGTISEASAVAYTQLDSSRIESVEGTISETISSSNAIGVQEIEWNELVVGDCIQKVVRGAVETVKIVACSGAHAGVVTDVFEMAMEEDAPFPGVSAFLEESDTECPTAESIYHPQEDSWREGTRTVVCVGLPKPND